MLHQVMMFRFDETDRVMPAKECPAPSLADEMPVRGQSMTRLVFQVMGNAVVGAALLGGLLLVPHLLANVLGLVQ